MRSTREQVRGLRLSALAIDAAIAASGAHLLGSIPGWVAARTGPLAPALVVVVWSSAWGIFFAALLLRDAIPGGSPGRRITGLRVVGRDGRPPDAGASIRRNLPILIPGWNLWEDRVMRRDVDQRRIGDRWAGTRVEEV